MVKAEFRGPQFGSEIISLVTTPNQAFEVGSIRVPGDYTLFNVRVEDADGNVLLERDPSLPPIQINVIEELLATSVTSRALTAEEITDLGIVFDDENFQVLNFSVGLTFGSNEVNIDLPVATPIDFFDPRNLRDLNAELAKITTDRLETLQIPNLQLMGFELKLPPRRILPELNLPPISGVIIIPGDIAFLNQFFSVFIQTTNLAPDGSGLEVLNATAAISLPLGEDDIEETGDDPLRLAETIESGIQSILPLIDENDVDTIFPSKTNSAQFLVEGLREGSHVMDFDITGDVFIPSLGEAIPIEGFASGIVEVKNPTFDVILAHPNIVREGEAYSIFATVTNTSISPANFFSLNINSRGLSGARLAEDETGMKMVETIPAGESETFEFNMIANITGEVTGTVFLADEGINGSFILTTGVGDTGIPLSADTLVLPIATKYLPEEPDITFATVRMLGQAYSVATAPAGTLPSNIPRINQSYVFDRGGNLGFAGVHTAFGQGTTRTAQDIVMDYFGADILRLNELIDQGVEFPGGASKLEQDIRAFDVLRRAADAGHNLTNTLADMLLPEVETQTLAEFQRSWAETFASRPAHLSFGVSSQGPPVLISVTDSSDNTTGQLNLDDEIQRDIPFADQFNFPRTTSGNDTLILFAAPQSETYQFEFVSPETTNATFSLIVPLNGNMVQVTYENILLSANAKGEMTWNSTEDNEYLISIDNNSDGIFESVLTPLLVTDIQDAPPSVIAVQQWGKGEFPLIVSSNPESNFYRGDAFGRLVGVLFNEDITKASAEELTNYTLEDNRANVSVLQTGNRLAFISLNKPVGPFIERSLTINNFTDYRGLTQSTETLPIMIDPELGDGAVYQGNVTQADGTPVPFAEIEYIQLITFCSLFDCFEVPVGVSDFTADANGQVNLDFILQDGLGPFRLRAFEPESEELAQAFTSVQFDGQRLNFDLILPGLAELRGRVFEPDGTPVEGTNPTIDNFPFAVFAQNVSTGELIATWINPEGNYQFPDSFEFSDGTSVESQPLTVGNVILRVVRTSDQFTALTTVNLEAVEDSETQDLILQPPNAYETVSGRVFENDGVTPASNVSIQVAGEIFLRQGLYSQQRQLSVIGVTQTDDEGFFQIEDVPVGNIEILAIRETTFEQTNAVSFLEFGDPANINLVLPGLGGTVRGVVRDSLGNLVANAQVAAGPYLVTTDENGFFENIQSTSR